MKSIRHFAAGVEKRRAAAALIAGAISLVGPQAVGIALADTGSTDSAGVSSAAPGSRDEGTPPRPPSGRGTKAAAPRSSGRTAGTRSGSAPLTERRDERPAGPGAASARTGGDHSPAQVQTVKIPTVPSDPAPSPSASAALPQTVPTGPVDVATTIPVTPVTPLTQALPTQAVALAKPVAAPVMAAPQAAVASSVVDSVLDPLLGSNPSAPVQSPVSWVVLAAVRRELGGAPTTKSPAATVSTGLLVAPAAATVPVPAATATNLPPSLQVVERQGSVSLLRDTTTGTAYVQSAGTPAVAVTRADAYWTGPVPVTRNGATLLAAARDSSGKLRVLDSSSYGQYGWTLNEAGLFTGEQKYDTTTLPGAETLFGVDLNNDGAIGSGGGGSTSTTGTGATGSFPMSLLNSTAGAYRDDQIFVTFLGQTTPGAWSWIDAAGQAHRLDHTAADAPGHLVKTGVNYADMSFTVAEAAGLPIPPTVQAGRVYVSVGEPLYIRVSPDDTGWAGPSPTNPTDPNFGTKYDWYEMSYSNGRNAFGGNTTQVDQFGLPITVTLEQAATGFAQTRGLTLTGDQVFTRFAQTVPSEFQSLLIMDAAAKPLRIVAPRTMQPAALATWLDAPVNDFWTKYKAEPFTYTGGGYTVNGRVDANSQFAYTVTAAGVSTAYTMRKPTTAQIFACDGPFVGGGQQGAFLAELSAAFNRGVATAPRQWNNVAAYYPTGQRWNAYAKFFHDISVGHYAYGFPYDDVNSQSSVQILGNTASPGRLTISVLAGGTTSAPLTPPLQVVEGQGSVSLLRDTKTGMAYVQSAGTPPVAVTRADSYWKGPVPLTRGGATLLAAARDSSGKLRVLDSSSNGQYGWTLNEAGQFTGEQKYDTTTLAGAETLFGVDLNNDGTIGAAPVAPPTGGVDPKVWTLTWADEFNGPNAKPDSSKWAYDIGGGGYGNAELQYYTDRTQNVSTDAAGHLAITAIKENLPGSGCWYGACQYTSGRILTKNLFAQQYGRFEASMKLPAGQGMWPAFWMQDDATGSAGASWPARGELDIMEQVGSNPSRVFGTVHTQISGGPGTGAALQVADACTAFHNYQMTWTADSIQFGLDGTNYYRYANPKAGYNAWPFDLPQYLLLNIAIGGTLGGAIDDAIFPVTLEVEHVRVYQPAK